MADAVAVAWYASAALGSVESLRKTAVNRDLGPMRGRWHLTAAIACMALSLAAGDPVTVAWTDRATGLHSVAVVAHHVLAMLAMVFVAGFLRTVGRLRLPMPVVAGAFAVVTAAMLALYLRGGVHTAGFGAPRTTTASSLIYCLLYLAYMAFWLIQVMLRLVAVATAEVRVLRVGVVLTQLGATLLLTGILWRLSVVVQVLAGPHHPTAGTHVVVLTDAAGPAVLFAGSALAAAVRHVQDRIDLRRRSRRAASLERLWRQVRILLAHRRTPPLDPVRQLVEIEDALLIVGQQIDLPVAQSVRARLRDAGITGDTAEKMALAAEIHIALAVVVTRLSRPPEPDGRPSAAAPMAWSWETGNLTVDDDGRAAWLAEVADLLTANPVAAIVAELGSGRR